MYILIECVEREIFVVDIYDREEEAYFKMEERLAETLEVPIHEDWDNVEDFDRYDEFDIQSDSAWISDYHGCNYDWKIVRI